jgi:hypothetical protein
MGLLDDIFSLCFPDKEYGTRGMTRLGVNVRNQAEQTLGEYFEKNNIRYEYERRIETGIWIFTEKVSAPDFYLPDYDVYVEYWGMLDVDDERKRGQYERTMKYKMARYYDLGIKFISIYPRDMKNLDWVFRNKLKQATGRDFSATQSPLRNEKKQTCPKCGATMVLRTARKGKSAGNHFWGCSNFPKCRSTLPNR